MSLSAPELGAEPPLFEPLRTAVSSSELLYERSLQRFRKAAEAEEAELAARANISNGEEKLKVIEDDSERRPSIPKILINSKDQEDLIRIEKKHSFSRRASAGGGNVTHVWAKRRHSLRNHPDYSDLTETGKLKTDQKFTATEDLNLKTSDNCLLPQKTELENKEDKYIDNLTPDANISDKRKEMMLRQRSESEEKEEEEFAKVRARMENEKKPIKNNTETPKVMTEEKWEEDSESEELSDEDDRLKYDTMPPLLQADEQETYHPRMSNIVNTPKHEEPFEILTKPSPLPDPNFIPKPILKKSEEVKKVSPEKPPRTDLGHEPEKLSPSPTDGIPTRSRTPSPSPGRTVHRLTPIPTTAVETQIQQQAAEAARNKRNLMRNNSEEENTVVIDYYGAIVRQYGTIKKGQSFSSDSDESSAAGKAEDVKEKPSLSTLEVLAKYAKSSKEDEDEDEKAVNNILAQYQNLNNKKQIDRPKPAISRRQPSPIPLSRKPLVSQEPTPNRQSSPNRLLRRSIEVASQEPVIPKRSPSPSISRRPKEISTPEKRRKTSRTRSSSRTRQSQRIPLPPEVKPELNDTKPPSPRPLTPEQEVMQLEAEINMRSSIDYLTDLSMFVVACWLYFFKNPLLAIPVLLVMVYRQLKDECVKYIPSWMIKTKKQ